MDELLKEKAVVVEKLYQVLSEQPGMTVNSAIALLEETKRAVQIVSLVKPLEGELVYNDFGYLIFSPRK